MSTNGAGGPASSSGETAWVPVARLIKPQGRRGELLAEMLTDLRELFSAGRQVWLAASTGEDAEPADNATAVTLEEHWFPTGRNAGRIVLKLAGVDSISEAEALSPRNVLIPASDLPELEADTFFVRDLLGCTLWNGETAVGEVVDVEFATGPDGRTRLEDAAPLLVVQPAGSDEELMIPLIRAWITEADLHGKRLVMALPEGLTEAEQG